MLPLTASGVGWRMDGWWDVPLMLLPFSHSPVCGGWHAPWLPCSQASHSPEAPALRGAPLLSRWTLLPGPPPPRSCGALLSLLLVVLVVPPIESFDPAAHTGARPRIESSDPAAFSPLLLRCFGDVSHIEPCRPHLLSHFLCHPCAALKACLMAVAEVVCGGLAYVWIGGALWLWEWAVMVDVMPCCIW